MVKEIVKLVNSFQNSVKQQLPALEGEVNDLTDSKCQDENKIEWMLDMLLSFTMMNVADNLFIQLLEYYKTVNTERANFYWQEFDEVWE